MLYNQQMINDSFKGLLLRTCLFFKYFFLDFAVCCFKLMLANCHGNWKEEYLFNWTNMTAGKYWRKNEKKRIFRDTFFSGGNFANLANSGNKLIDCVRYLSPKSLIWLITGWVDKKSFHMCYWHIYKKKFIYFFVHARLLKLRKFVSIAYINTI